MEVWGWSGAPFSLRSCKRQQTNLSRWRGILPVEHRFETPQNDKSVARIVYHMLYYEREIALPGANRLLQGGPATDDETILAAEDEHWEREGSAMAYDAMLDAFQRARAEYIALAPQLAPLWNAPCVPDVDHPGMITHIPRLETLKTINHTLKQENVLLFRGIRLALLRESRPYPSAAAADDEDDDEDEDDAPDE